MMSAVWTTTLLLSALVGAPDRADPAPQVVAAQLRAPLEAGPLRENDLDLDRYFREVTVVRTRTPGKSFATFSAEPRLLDDGAAVVFEISSVAKSGVVNRWRCVATVDVAECLGTPVKIAYLPADEAIRLTAKLLPKADLDAKPAVASR
jgi:hypothetical protein